MKYLLIILLLISGLSTHAEIVTDGTLGAKLNLPGPDFQITADLGQQHGGNLFHSFQDFNLQGHESATFSGPDNVQNVIGRVTGGNPSTIDGLIRSTIPNADVYFLNPYGILFGPNAKLDVQGGFHASTADYLRLQDGGRFETRYPNESILTVAPIESFGFLTDTPATITTQDSTLMVPPFKPLSLIGGPLHLRGSLPLQFDDLNIYAQFATSLLKTVGGPLYLAAVGSAGEVQVDNPDFTLTGQGGEIRLDRTLVDTSGPGSGHLKIRGNQLWMQDSTLQANTLGEMDGGLMDLRLTESLQVTSEPYLFQSINNKNMGHGKGGSVHIQTPECTLSRTVLATNPLTEADGGSTDLEVVRLTLLEGAGLTNAAFGGKAGPLTIKATDSVLIAGTGVGSSSFAGGIINDPPSHIDSSVYPNSLEGSNINLMTSQLDLVGGIIASTTLGKGKAGNITIQADNVNLTAGGFIASSNPTVSGGGVAGNISVTATDTLSLSGRRAGTYVVPVTNQRVDHNQSSIQSGSLSGSGGQINLTAKNIHLTEEALISTSSLGLGGENTSRLNLQAETLRIADGGQINSSNGIVAGTTFLLGTGSGGNIHIQAKHLMLSNQSPHSQQTSVLSDTYGQGQGGSITVQSDTLNMTGDATISARSFNIGAAGQIDLRTNHLYLAPHSSISTAAVQAGGGNIFLNGLTGLLYLDNSEITTSVTAGQGSGGNITIEKPQFVVLNQSRIIAQADAGHGGNIRIVADQFIKSPHSIISASSRLGVDGNVNIEALDETVSDSLTILSEDRMDASAMMKKPCTAEDLMEENHSHFYVNPINGVRPAPHDRQGSGILPTLESKVVSNPALLTEKGNSFRRMRSPETDQFPVPSEKRPPPNSTTPCGR